MRDPEKVSFKFKVMVFVAFVAWGGAVIGIILMVRGLLGLL
jgi:hypothetical protein